MKSIFFALSLVLLAMTLSGCVIALGNRDLDHPRPTTPTLGRELTDLKKARDAGALTEEEYQESRSRLLEKRGRH